MLTTHRLSLMSLSLFLLLGLSLRASAADLPLPLEAMPGKTLADVKDRAATESTAGPVWGNAPDPKDLPVHQTFRGTVTADANMTKLAIFSDDGCDVYVDGTLVWSAKDKGQALPDLPNSLHELPVTLTPGDHSVQIDYSNVIYTVADASKGIAPDIDGCTLFQYGTVPVVHVNTGSWQPNPAAVGQTITSAVTTQVDNPPSSPDGHPLSEQWGWTTGGVYQSPNGASGSFVPSTEYAIVWHQGSPTTEFSGIFQDSGYYIIKVIATVTYYDDAGNFLGSYSGIGYIGGDATDLASPPAGAPAIARARAAALSAAPGATTGLPVVKIAKLQYAYGTSTKFQDLPAPIKGVPQPLDVDAGTTVVFKAIPDTPGASFPQGQPQWSGVKGTASGDTDTVVFTTLNKTALPADYQTVTAAFGPSTASAIVLVQGVTITTDALADTDPSATVPTPLLKRVKVNSTEYGAGTTLSLVVTPVNGFKGKVTLGIDVNSTKPDVFGLTATGQDSSGSKIHYSFYNPLDRDGNLHIDEPSYFTLDCTDQKPETIILTLTVGANKSSLVDAGGYKVIVFANPNDQGNTRMGKELLLPVTVVKYTAPDSGKFSGGANDGLYRAGRTYDRETLSSTTGDYYDAFSGVMTLPFTSPDSMSLVLDYGTGDAYDVYSGGLAFDPTTRTYSELDIGLTVGHTGNFGFSPTSNFNQTPEPPDNDEYDQIQPGQTLRFTFEAPGCPDVISGDAVPEQTAYLVIQPTSSSASLDVSPKNGTATIPVQNRVYKFTGLPAAWQSRAMISVKYITSIAQNNHVTSYILPPNLSSGANAKDFFFYSSGSKATYVTWSSLQVHKRKAASGLTPFTLPVTEASPGDPYTTSSELNTLPD